MKIKLVQSKLLETLILIVFSCALCIQGHAKHWDKIEPQPFDKYQGEVVHHSDGDTLDIKLTSGPFKGKITRVRMLNIDTPESVFQGLSQGPIAEEASKVLKTKLAPIGTKVKVEYGPVTLGPWRRSLATIYRGRKNINRELIRLGLAFPIFFAPHIDKHRSYWRAANEAKKKRRGVWDPKEKVEVPHRFRLKNSNRNEANFVGHMKTKTIVPGSYINFVPEKELVFFPTNSDGQISLRNFLKKYELDREGWAFLETANACEGAFVY